MGSVRTKLCCSALCLDVVQYKGAMESAIAKDITSHEQGRISVMNIRKDSFDSLSLSFAYVLHQSEIPAGKTQ